MQLNKMKVMLLIIICVLSCGCQNKLEVSTKKIADAFVSSLYDSSFDNTDLDADELVHYNILLDSFKKGEKIINLKEECIELLAEAIPPEEMIQDNFMLISGIPFIKYEDVEWQDIDYMSDSYGYIQLDDVTCYISKNSNPSLEDSQGNVKYVYQYSGMDSSINAIKHTYKSVYDKSSLTVIFKLGENEITSIDTKFN